MKKLVYISLFLTTLWACKNDAADMVPSTAAFQTVTGTWHLKEFKKSTLDNKDVWEPIQAGQSDTLIFRGDGVLLQTDGKPRCCAPRSLDINGQLVDIIPATPLPYNDFCATVNCVNCPVWEIQLNGNEMIVNLCLGTVLKYVR